MKINKIISLACALGVLGSFAVDAECMSRGAEDNLGAPAANIERLSPEINDLTAKAKAGDDEAQYDLGFCYEYGEGVERNAKTAAKLYQQAADQGHAAAKLSVARLTKLLQEAEELIAKAETGDAKAQYELGNRYYAGEGVAKNPETAAKLYQQAANKGHIEAQYKLGFCYKLGKGVEQDYEQSLLWYQKAADQGHIEAQDALDRLTKLLQDAEALREKAETGDAKAQFELGFCYEYGQCVAKDLATAFQWYEKAADQGHRDAQYRLGLCYESGQGVAKDTEKAFQLYEKAAKKGHVFAKEKLETKELIAKANDGDAEAQYKLGLCYEYGTGVVEVDTKKAFQWFEKAAEKGHRQAQFMLGCCYESGHGVAHDTAKAFQWYQKAADQGHAQAKRNLDRLTTNK